MIHPTIDPERIAEQNEPLKARLAAGVEHLAADLDAHGPVTAEAAIEALVDFSVAAPSWAVGTGGTRFGRFPMGGEPRTTEEKIDDIAALNLLTGANQSVSLHVPWDDVVPPGDPADLLRYAADRGIWFDAMNSNTFQDNPSTTDNLSLIHI